MYQGKDERGGGGVRWFATAAMVAVAAAVLGIGVWFVVRDGGTDADGTAPVFSFDVATVRGLGFSGKVDRPQLRQPAGRVRTTLDALYSAAFVDPEKWQGGRFPAVVAAFAGPAQGRARRDLGDLTLGRAASAIESVRPEPGELRLRFLLDDGAPLAVVARTSFQATALLRDGGRLELVHEGRFLLRRSGDRWVIVGYDVDGRIEPAGRGDGGPGG